MVKYIDFLYLHGQQFLSFIIAILTSSILVFFLYSAGEAVEKGKLSITDTTGKAIDSVVLEVPSEDAPEDKSIDVVKGGHLINPKFEYIIDAEGHKSVIVTGEDLIQSGGVQLKPAPKRHMVILHEKQSGSGLET